MNQEVYSFVSNDKAAVAKAQKKAKISFGNDISVGEVKEIERELFAGQVMFKLVTDRIRGHRDNLKHITSDIKGGVEVISHENW